MKPLAIEGTEDSPKVDFNTANNILELSGVSRPENPGKFYEYLAQWVENYGKYLSWRKGNQQDHVIFKVKLDYFNSTSAKHILVVLNKLSDIYKDYRIPVDVNWYYDDMDISMKESGEEYSKLLPKLTFHFIQNQ
ncbi:MAG: DUF1987 domain-containing protein [Bacteroidetes bacterium]|nr:DUF1987 domain-containing protein [Bacteroidota bacterium]